MRWIISLLLVTAPVPAMAQDVTDADERPSDNLIHSDLPLYTFDWEEIWPQSFADGGSFGCLNRVRTGDWRLRHRADEDEDDSDWIRLENAGVFHCAIYFQQSPFRDELDQETPRPGFMVEIGEAERDGRTWELWAAQIGMRPGSDYMLLAKPNLEEEPVIESFTVLQRRCPEGAERRVEGNLDVWTNRYCAINSQDDLLALAKDMFELPPLGMLELVETLEVDTPETAD